MNYRVWFYVGFVCGIWAQACVELFVFKMLERRALLSPERKRKL